MVQLEKGIIVFCLHLEKLAIVTKIGYLDYFIICNETFFHYETLCFILKILVEKPLFEKMYILDNLENNNIYVAYKTRCYIQVGQYWRKDVDSKKKEEGCCLI